MVTTVSERADAQILVVDDDASNVELVARILEPEGYRHVARMTDPKAAAALCAERPPDLVLLDLRMPGMDGLQVIETLREGLPPQDFPVVIVLTSDDSRQAKQQALARGAFDFIAKPLSPYEVRLRVGNAIDHRLLQRTLVLQNEELERLIEVRTGELEDARVQILERLAIAAEYHDPETARHTRRVGEMSARIAAEIGWPAREIDLLRRVADAKDPGIELPGLFYSYLGFGVARFDRRVREGLTLCEHAVKREFYQPENYLNLARTHLLAGNRER